MIADVNGVAVLALAAPQFAALSREQRLVAYWATQAFAAGDAVAAEQGYRKNVDVIRLLSGILGRPQVVPPGVLSKVRAFARAVYLNHGIHDATTGRKLSPPFSAAELRTAALAAQAAGANLGVAGPSLEYALRALEGSLFDPQVASESLVTERLPRVPAVADALDRALPFAAPPQRAVIEALSAFFRAADVDAQHAAEQAWAEAFGPADLFAGFVESGADPRGRKGLFAAVVGVADPERSEALEGLGRRPAEALFLAGAAGASRPLRSWALTLEAKTALFAAAEEAAARVRGDRVIAALADPRSAADLGRCAPALRFAALALRETARPHADGAGVFDEILADVTADILAPSASTLVPDAACRALWAPFVAVQLSDAVASSAEATDDRRRALLVQTWWFASKGALAERRSGGKRFLAAADPARFTAAATELRDLLQAEGASSPKVRDLIERHSAADAGLRDDLLARLSGIPRRVAVLPPRLDPVLQDGAVVDAQAVAIQDLDDQILRDWTAY